MEGPLKFTLGQGFEVFTPDQVTLFGTSQVTGVYFDYPSEPDKAIRSAVIASGKSLSLELFKNVIALCAHTSFSLKRRYSFKYGYSMIIPLTLIPKEVQDSTEKIDRFFEFVSQVMTIHGWIVDVTYADGDYTMAFEALEVLTPGDVRFEIYQKANRIAGKALGKINHGLVNRQDTFTCEELGIKPDLDNRDFLLVITRLRTLLGKQWDLTSSDDDKTLTITAVNN